MVTVEATTSAVQVGSVETYSSFSLGEAGIDNDKIIIQSDSPERDLRLLLSFQKIESSTYASLVTFIERDVLFLHSSTFFDEFKTLLTEDTLLEYFASLNLSTSNVPPKDSDVNRQVSLYQIRAFNVPLRDIPLSLIDKGASRTKVIVLEANEEVSADDSLTLIDIIGPEVVNATPAGGTRLNNPSTEITFDLVDYATGVNQSTIQIFIQGTKVVQNGIPLIVEGFGQSFLTKVSDNLYQFRFIKDEPFDLYEVVTVSGEAEDLTIPSNYNNFEYKFSIWDESDLSAEIIGTPDEFPPFLVNLLPEPGQLQVDPNYNISIEIGDAHTGVDPNSVFIEVDGDLVVESGKGIPALGEVSITPLPLIRGYRYEIDLHQTLPFSHQTVVKISASDLFTVENSPNLLEASYSFRTTSDEHLIIENLSLLNEDGHYDIIEALESLPSADPSHFRVTFRDFSGEGIDLENSFVYHNGEKLDVVFTPVDGESNDGYYVDFSISPYYYGESVLRFRATQIFSELSEGSIAPYRDEIITLQWGYQVCYNPEQGFERETEIGYCVKILDRGDFPRQGTYCSSFSTMPFYNSPLNASIRGIELDPNSLLKGSYDSINSLFQKGKTMHLEIEAKDYQGNILIFPWKFTLEE